MFKKRHAKLGRAGTINRSSFEGFIYLFYDTIASLCADGQADHDSYVVETPQSQQTRDSNSSTRDGKLDS